MAKINDVYDIGAAFEAIENELMASMIRNMKRHKVEESDEKMQWSMWQTEMLKSMEKYKHDNKKKYGKQFKDINAKISGLIAAANIEGQMEQEKKILEAIRKGFPAKRVTKGGTAEFFKLNDRKLEALIKATIDDMEKAETAVLRMANDQYRKIIYNAQVYANTGAATYETAVDMATKDFLKAGLNCIQYANGARHTIADYADMAIRTASKRAYLQGEGVKRQEWGVHTVIINKRGSGCPCPLCVPFVGKVMVDDVWSGGTRKEASETGYKLLSEAIAAGLYHPRCRDSHTTYFPGISTPPDGKFTKKEIKEIEKKNKQEARQQYAERQEKKYKLLTDMALDGENEKKYKIKQKKWHRQGEVIKDSITVQDNRNVIKAEVADAYRRQNSLVEQLRKLEETEHALTQKVYFELTGTPKEIEQLKQASEQKKAIGNLLEDLKNQILNKQEIYKNVAEKQLVKDGILENVKFSRKMKPEAVDDLESTIRNLHEKYGIMPKAVVYSPVKVENATATYNWIDDTIYISNNFNDPDKYLEQVRKSEHSLVEYNEHHDIKRKAEQRHNEAEKILADKSVKGYEREKARIQKVEAEIQLNEKRAAVRENVTDCFVHEYGHFIHRHAAENPYETFAEGFLAMEKGETIPEQIAKIINDAKNRACTKK